VEGAAAFDEYVQRKAKEIGLDLATLPEPARNQGPPAGAPAGAPGGPAGTPGDWNPRFVNGRTARGFDFMQQQRRRYAMVVKWGEYMKDLDMFIAAPAADVGANAQTGHPCVVVPYKFDVPTQPQGGGGGGGGAAAAAAQAPRVELKPQPICATIVGALYNDDAILAVANRFQRATDIHLKRPAI
jgi:hypothetical protein